jgi:hypothetical protein
MASTPRSTIEDSYADGLQCAICGAGTLRVGHVANLPDYVTCGECGSAFLVEDGGERIFYGQIASDYPDAEKFALRQWAFPEAIENRAKPDRPTLPDFEESSASEAPAAEPEPEPETIPERPAPAEPQAPPTDERPTKPYMEFEGGPSPEPEPQARPEPEAPEPEPAGSEFDFLSELAAEGPSPEPGEEPAPEPPQAEKGEFDFLSELATGAPPAEPSDEFAAAPVGEEQAGSPPETGLEPGAAAPEAEAAMAADEGAAPPAEADQVEEDFLLGLMAGEAESEPPDLEPSPAGAPAVDEPAAGSGVDFLAGLEAAEEPAEPEASGLVDSEEPHPADTLTPPPWARTGEPEGDAGEETPPASWHEFTEAEEEAGPDITSEFFQEPADEDAGTPEEIPSFESDDDPLGLASAFEALTPDSGEAGPAQGEGAETPAWMQFEDVEAAPEAEEAEEFDAFASLRAELEAEHPQVEPDEETPEAEPEGEFEPFEFNQRMSAFGGAEEDEELEGATEDEDDFLSGLRRSAAVPLESEPLPDASLGSVNLESKPAFKAEEPAPDDEAGEDPLAMAARMGAISAEPEAEAMPEWMQEEQEEEQAEPKEARGAFHLRETDPPPGQRYRVVLLGDRVVFPGGDCAHCGRTPVKGRLAVYGTLPNGQKVGQRKVTSFNVPLCADCRERAALQTEEAGNARLQAHLISGIIGMVLVVLALVTGIINTSSLGAVDIMILVILALVGYAGPVTFLLNRAGSYPPPPDAAYVRTTLLVPSETQGLETAFEWRSEEYAGRFFEANQANAIGRMTAVKDRLAPVG